MAAPAVNRASYLKRRMLEIEGDLASCNACEWRVLEGAICAHHIVPLSCGGESTLENLILLCPNCHAVAHHLLRWGGSTGLCRSELVGEVRAFAARWAPT